MTINDPNFPDLLEIKPSVVSHAQFMALDPSDQNTNAVFGFQAQEASIRRYGIAGRVWEAAYILAFYIDPSPQWEFDPSFWNRAGPLTMIELGSGVGMVSAIISNKLCHDEDIIIVTDLPEVCPLLVNNLKDVKIKNTISSSQRDAIFVRPLSWGNGQHESCIASEFFTHQDTDVPRSLTHIICSDLVYFPELLAPLLRTLIHLSSPPFCHPLTSPTIIMSYKIRSLTKETRFWSAFGLWFDFRPVLAKKKSGKHAWRRFGFSFDDTTFIFVAHRRIDSFCWQIPSDDADLLAGAGARGTRGSKGDDTFESLLFMSLEDDSSEEDV